MNKRITDGIIAVIVGLCWFTLFCGCVSIFTDVLLMGDMDKMSMSGINNDLDALVEFIKWTALALTLLLVPAFVCGAFRIFTKNKIFSVICSALHLIVLVCAIGFFCKLHAMAVEDSNATLYTVAVEYFENYISVITLTALLCAYYVYESVLGFVADRKKGEKEPDAADGQTEVTEL